MKILAANPRASYETYKHEIENAIQSVLDRGLYVLGQEVAEFEREFAAYIGREDAVGVASGTDAIQLALWAAGIGPGDIVVTVSHTAVATVAAIELVGATPLLIDVDPATYTMDPNLFEEAISAYGRQIRGVIPVHLYGHPAAVGEISAVARDNEVLVLEDCAQSHGACIQGRKTGCWGQLAAFSFYPTKNLGALGDGGAVVGGHDLTERVRLLRQYGWRNRFVSDVKGTNSRLDEIQAAVLRVKLTHLEEDNKRRREIASIYSHNLVSTSLVLPEARPGIDHAYHLYVVRSIERDSLSEYLQANSVGTAVHYPVPVHMQPAYAGRLPTWPTDLRHTEQVCREILSLPMHPHLSDEDVQRVTELIILWESSKPSV